jgi:hypothetical protein
LHCTLQLHGYFSITIACVGAVQLADMMLSPRGMTSEMVNTPSGERVSSTRVAVCKRCRTGLKGGRVPHFAIANHFAIGALPPEFADTTWAEFALVSSILRTRFAYAFRYIGCAHV